MTSLFSIVPALLVLAGLPISGAKAATVPTLEVGTSTYGQWKNGLPNDTNYFPIAVWLQTPWNARSYQQAGINLFIGLWEGPTTNQLAELRAIGMPVICAQNQVGLENKDSPIIVGWMHGDEPDNAQGIPGLRRYGPPIPTEKVVADYQRIKAADPSRPILLNLGQGVAWDNYIGRGVRRNHPEDYLEYVKGSDIVSFDIYPAAHDSPEIQGKLEYVAQGVARLVKWAGPDRIVWNCIECTQISNPPRKATPDQVRSEVWMALIHGSRGLIYFVHQFEPKFNEAALLADPQMLAAVTAINRQVRELAPVLNSPTIATGVKVRLEGAATQETSSAGAIATLQKRVGNGLYVFTVNMRNAASRAQLSVSAASAGRAVEVLGEGRQIPLSQGAFTDSFKPYEAHLYRIEI